jgi:hypothetical protein
MASHHLSSYLVVIANAGWGVGGLSCGFIADQIGGYIPHIPFLAPFPIPLRLPPTSQFFSASERQRRWTGEHGATVRAVDGNGWTDTVEYSADDDGKDEAKISLHAAAEEGNIDTVESLLGRRMDINARNASIRLR